MPPKKSGVAKAMRMTKNRVRRVLKNVALVILVLAIGTMEFIVTAEIKGTTMAIVAWLLSRIKRTE